MRQFSHFITTNAISFQESLLTEKECTTLNRINDIAFKSTNIIYISPLHQSEIEMRYESPVHYDESPLAKMIDRIISSVGDFY
jgi:hypothetical protein